MIAFRDEGGKSEHRRAASRITSGHLRDGMTTSATENRPAPILYIIGVMGETVR